MDLRGLRAFVLAFTLAVVLAGALPVAALALRFAALGEFDVFGDTASLVSRRLYGPFDLPIHRYKYRMAAARAPRLMILGSSNVLLFRRAAFTSCPEQCFYNAGGGMPTTRTGADLVRQLAADRSLPEVLLVAVDPWHFNPEYAENVHVPTRLASGADDQLRFVLGVTRALAARLVEEPDLRELLVGARPVPEGHRGVRAALRSEGYRDDGSYAWGTVAEARVLAQSPSERSADVVDRIARSCCRFEAHAAIDPRSLAELEELIDIATGAGTRVVLFNVPLSDEVMDRVDRSPSQRAAIDRVRTAVREVAQRRSVPFVWTERPSAAGCPAGEMLDGFHPSEVCSARVVHRLLNDSEVARILRPFVDPQALASKLARPASALRLDPE